MYCAEGSTAPEAGAGAVGVAGPPHVSGGGWTPPRPAYDGSPRGEWPPDAGPPLFAQRSVLSARELQAQSTKPKPGLLRTSCQRGHGHRRGQRRTSHAPAPSACRATTHSQHPASKWIGREFRTVLSPASSRIAHAAPSDHPPAAVPAPHSAPTAAPRSCGSWAGGAQCRSNRPPGPGFRGNGGELILIN